MKSLILYIALALSAFTFTAAVQADDYEGFAPADHQSAAIGMNVVAIADCERCMYARLGDKQPLIAMTDSIVSEFDGLATVTAWTVPYEVGWRS